MNIKVLVKANARKEKFEALSKTSFSISVREKAEGNAANQRARTLVATYFKIPTKRVKIVSGHRSPSKTLSIP